MYCIIIVVLYDAGIYLLGVQKPNWSAAQGLLVYVHNQKSSLRLNLSGNSLFPHSHSMHTHTLSVFYGCDSES